MMRSFIKGFLLGFLCGAVAGTLLTSQNGPESTALFRQRVQEALQAGRQATQSYQDRLQTQYRQAIGVAEKEPETD